MIHRAITTALALLVLASAASAQAPARLRWVPGQVLLYRVEHSTFALDAVGETKTETRSLLKLTRRWQVTEVDAAGVATLVMSLTHLAQERTTPAGDTLSFDSAAPDKGTPQLKEYLSRFVNVPLATLRVDALGKVVEVKESKFGSAASYENELPFVGVLPAEGLKVDQGWERMYNITLAPPLGTGEKYEAVQHFVCKTVAGDLATVSLATDLKAALKAPADAVPLWQVMPSGEVVYDLKNGRLHSARLLIDKELKGHAGEGSATKFQSTYTIQYAGDK